MVDIDLVYSHIGEFGWQQKKYAAIILAAQAVSALHMVFMVFAGNIPQFTCKGGKRFVPQTSKEACKLLALGKCPNLRFQDQWLSIPVEYRLICDDAYKSSMAQSIFMLGFLVGSFIFGIVADKIGRQKTLLIVVSGATLCSILSGFTYTYEQFEYLRFLLGLCLAGHAVGSFVLLCELIGSSWRNTIGIALAACFALGIAFLSLLARITDNWRTFSNLVSLCSCVVYSLYLYVPESPRWLAQQNRFDEVTTILDTIAKGNGSKLPVDIMKEKSAEMTDKSIARKGQSITALLKHWQCAKWTAIQIFSWFANSCLYYGLTMASGSLSSNLYVSVMLSGLVELPAYCLLFMVMSRIGWIPLVSGSMCAGGAACLSILTLDPSPSGSIMRTILALLGKMAISASFASIYLQSAELFPTSARNSGIGICSVAARFGGVIAPLISMVGTTHPSAEYFLFGLIGLGAGILHLQLPETKGKPLPESVDDLLALAHASPKKRWNNKMDVFKPGSDQRLIEDI